MPSAPITTWCALKNKYEEYAAKPPRWIFRGQKDSSWGLEPSLERVMRDFKKPLSEMRPFEDRLLGQFKRDFHRYSQYLPEDRDKLEWLTLMQHHGAPTRLLDWTYSFYVALFFAVESTPEDQTCAIWAWIKPTAGKRCWSGYRPG